MNFDRSLTPKRIMAAGLLLGSSMFGIASYRLPLWLDETPGPGLTPLLACLCLLPLALFLIVEPTNKNDEEHFQWAPFFAWVSLAIFVALISWIGFVIPAALFSFVWAFAFYKRSFASSVAIAVLAPTAMYLVFVLALSVPLPMWPE